MQVIDISVHNTLTPLLTAALFTLIMASCSDLSEEEVQQVNEALQDSLTSSTETWGVDMEIIEEGEKKIRLRGSYATTVTHQEVNKTRIKGPVAIQVFDSTGAITTEVQSERAVYLPEEAIFELYGGVVVETANNRELQSEYLEWHQDDNIISTPKFVIITTPSDSLAGTGFEGTTDLVDFTIKEPTGKVTID